MAKTFAKPALMTWNGTKVTDHNRSPLSIDVTRIEEPTRMANGTMRKFVIADKRTYSTDWSSVPHSAGFTVDGFWGKNEMETFYNQNIGAFELKLFYGDGTSQTLSVMFTKFTAQLDKRGAYDMWQVSVEMVEV